MHGDLAGMRHDLVVGANVGGAKVDEDVDDEHDVDEQVDYHDRVVAVRLSWNTQIISNHLLKEI